eukprot:7384010-Prymnesium_polylepis.1
MERQESDAHEEGHERARKLRLFVDQNDPAGWVHRRNAHTGQSDANAETAVRVRADLLKTNFRHISSGSHQYTLVRKSPERKAVAWLSLVGTPVRTASWLAQSSATYIRGIPIGQAKIIASAIIGQKIAPRLVIVVFNRIAEVCAEDTRANARNHHKCEHARERQRTLQPTDDQLTGSSNNKNGGEAAVLAASKHQLPSHEDDCDDEHKDNWPQRAHQYPCAVLAQARTRKKDVLQI